ncbi:MAG: ATP-binding protein [Candidatus Hydrothermarchaeales archaeon]
MDTGEEIEHLKGVGSIIDDIDIPLHVIDRDFRVVEWNKAMEEFSGGVKREDIAGKTLFDGSPWLRDVVRDEEYEKAFETGKPSSTIERREYRNKEVYTDTRLIPIKDQDGDVVKVLTLLYDITERKDLEGELKDHIKQLEHSNKLKELFTDILRHDLLTPLCIIQNLAELMIDSDSPEEVEGGLQMIRRNAMEMQRMVHDATKYARLESIDEFDLERGDLSGIIAEAIDRLQSYAEAKGIEIENNVEGEFLASLNPLIEDVFANLLSNAIKYSPSHSRVVVGIDDGGENWRTMVKDFGGGIPDEYKKNIFHRFERVDKGGVKGVGLGLAIAKRIVELHKGEIWVEDNPEGGSIFYFTLPKAVR